MTQLTEAQREQIKNMRHDGKTYQEIRDFFKTSYDIILYDGYIAAIMKGSNTTHQPGVTGKGPKKQKKIAAEIDVSAIHVESGEEFVEHIRAAYGIYKKGFMRSVENAMGKV